MSIRIVLDNEVHGKSPFHSGSQIAGSVRIDVDSASFSVQKSFTQVELCWTCCSDLQFERRVQVTTADPVTRTFKSKATLFDHKLLLTDRTFIPAASQRGEDGGTIVFPFNLTVPVYAEPILSSDTHFTFDDDRFPPEDPWPGSASFYIHAGADYQRQHLPSSSNGKFFYVSGPLIRFTGTVDYALQATLPNTKKLTTQLVNVVNCVADPCLSAVDSWVGRDYETQVRISEMNHTSFWKRTFNRGPGSEIKLSIEFQSQQVLLLNAREDECMPFKIRVKTQRTTHDDRVDQGLPTPKIYLTRLNVSLKGHVAARTNPSQKVQYLPHSAHGLDENTLFDWKEGSKKDSRQEVPEDTFWDLGSSLGIKHAAMKRKRDEKSRSGRQPQPMSLVPDIYLPNLVRNYSLVWKLRLEYGGQQIDWVYGVKEGQGLPIMLKEANGASDADESLPSYEADPRVG